MEVRVLSSAQAGGQARARGLAGRRLLCKEKIVGSNPTGSTLCKVQSPVKDRPPSRVVKYVSGRSSAVERLLAKEKVVSSNLIARSQRVGHAADPFDENLIGRGSSVGRAPVSYTHLDVYKRQQSKSSPI